jgi:hypothetical protein
MVTDLSPVLEKTQGENAARSSEFPLLKNDQNDKHAK